MRSQRATAIVLAGTVIGTLCAQDLPPVRNSYGAFAFPNMQGTELIVLHDVPRAAEMSTAICDRQTLRIRFVRRQTGAQTGAGMPRADRDSPEQFKRLAGSVFEVVGRPVPSGVTCFVAADPLLANAELLRVQMRAQPRECTAEEQQRAGALRSRSIRRCWSIAVGQRLGLISLVEYVRLQQNALASLIVAADHDTLAIDYAATFKAEGQDLWRVDDGGEFSPDGFQVPFIVRRDAAYFIAVDWHGSEGHSLALHSVRPGTASQQLLADYWYRAPR